MSESEARCANPRCPTHPIIIDDYDLPSEQRRPCPVCGSRSRAFSRLIRDSATISDSVSVHTDAGMAEVRAVTQAAAVLTAESVLTAEAEVLPGRLTLLGLPATHELVVVFADLIDEPDPPCIIEIQSPDGRLLTMGAGKNPADALSVLFERMLPPSSSERHDPVEDEPLPDDE
jgi:hypothetical protein